MRGGGNELLINRQKVAAKQKVSFRDLLNNIESMVNSNVLYTQKLIKKVDLILSALTAVFLNGLF